MASRAQVRSLRRAGSNWWKGLRPTWARLWAVLCIHLVAFGVLYLLMFGLIERAASKAGARAARFQLDEAVRQMPLEGMGSTPHTLSRVLASQRGMGLRLYRADGTPLGASGPSAGPAEVARVENFLAGKEPSESWVVSDGGRRWVRAMVRITAGQRCTPCHTLGATLGVATVRIDFTASLAAIQDRLRGRMALLLGGWVVALGLVTMVVQRNVAKAGVRLRADLASADAGQEASPPALSLDPVTAEVHRNLREALRQQRERESQLVTRLAHVDQLACVGQLAAGLAHEIKNPLAGIQGVLEVLRDEASVEPTKHLYGEMLEELGRVDGILRRLLESARPAPPRLARIDLDRLLAETTDLLRPTLHRRRIELRVETAEGLPKASLDAAQMRQVLVNLVHNAAEAMPESGGHVIVRAGRVDDEGTVAITVEDDGSGIAPENLDQVFEPFFTTKFTGTGLGLAIAKSLVEQHGGRLDVSSEVGRGTSFVILLPQRATQEAAIAVGEPVVEHAPACATEREARAWR